MSSSSTSVGLSTSAAQGVYVPSPSGYTNPVYLSQTLRQLAAGQTNAKGVFTLSSTGATLVTEANPLCAPNSIISWTPVTPEAAAQMATVFVLSSNVTTGQFLVSQASNTSTASIFNYVIHS